MELLAWISITIALACALTVAVDEAKRPQTMAIMNVVWPATCLYFSVFGLWAYLARGRAVPAAEQGSMHLAKDSTRSAPLGGWQIALSASHCGAGCALADIVAESAVFFAGATIAGSSLYASFLWDLLLAWTVGIAFQYFTIKPMRHLSPARGVLAAVKADTLSIASFQVGMYAWMAVAHRLWHLDASRPAYWLSMQGAMVLGFSTSLPMNWLLLRLGFKERMG